MAQTSKTRIKDMSIDPASIKLPEKYRVEQNESSTTTEKPETGGFETMVDRMNKKKPKKPPELRPSHHHGHGRISNWVCVKNISTSEVLRVRREDAEKKLLPTGKYQYTNKTEWRNFVKKKDEITSTPEAPQRQKNKHQQRRPKHHKKTPKKNSKNTKDAPTNN